MSLEQYRRRVEKLARQRNGEPIYNGSPDHASIIVEQMFKNAREQVLILTGRLNARVYGREEVLEELRLFLAERDHSICVLMEEPEKLELDHPFMEELQDNSNATIKRLPNNVAEDNPYHFMVMDKDSYRFEPDKDNYAAVAAFGEKGGAQNLISVFNALWEAGEDYEPENRVKEYA